MSTLAFNRKYRSQRFEDLVGQGHVATTLRNAVKHNRVAHAYLFCGPRGCGKTSAARILAKAINCANAPEGEPCGTCESCVAIAEGRAIDVVEADAASNRGIDDIRSIRERVGLAPAAARFKIYILDEAHMLTIDASNALLKTLEEPPSHAIFVLVTTDPQKLPETIVSRCQRLDFRRISVTDATSRLAYVCEREGIAPEPGLLDLLARTASGSLRDAEGALDQLVAFAGKQPTLRDARAILGAVGSEASFAILNRLVVERDAAAAILEINRLADQGADTRALALAIVDVLRDALLLRTSDRLDSLVDRTEDEREQLRAIAGEISVKQLVELIRLFQPGPPTRGSFRPQLPLELAAVEAETLLACSGQAAPVPTTPPASARPITRPTSPTRIETPASFEVARSSASVGISSNGETHREEETTPTPPEPRTEPAGVSSGPQPGILLHEARRHWNDILDRCGSKSRSLQAVLRSGQVIGDDAGTLVLGFPYPFHVEKTQDPRNRAIVEEIVEQVLGQKVRVRSTQISRETRIAGAPLQAAMDDPLVKAAIEMGARVRNVTVEGSEEGK